MRDKVIYSYLAALLIILPSFSRLARSENKVKVALIADKAFDLDKSPLISLLEVKLSQKQGIELLERAEIDKILQEQQLSVAGLLQRHSAVKVGRLLRVDAFVLLSIEDSPHEKQYQKRLLRVRVTETAHGLRLLDTFEELDIAKLKEIVERITNKVTAIVPKIMLPPGEAIPVGIVDIHRVQLGERYQWLARALPAILSVRLSKELRIIMLEREDLKILHDEKLLTAGEDTEFWSSGVLIEGYLRPSRAKDIEMQLSLRQASGKEIAGFTVLVEPNEPLEAVEKAATDIIEQLLDAPPSVSWQPEQEAAEFFRQGQLLRNLRRHEDARQPLETTHALQPGNVYYTWELFENEWDVRYPKGFGRLVKPTGIKLYSDLELAEIVSALIHQMQKEYEKSSLSTKYIMERWAESLGLGDYEWGYFLRPDSASTEKVKLINRDSRKIFVETTKQALNESTYKNEHYRKYWTLNVTWCSSDNPDELIKNIKRAYASFIMPPETGGGDQPFGERWAICRSGLLLPPIIPESERLKKTHLKGHGKHFRKLWAQYLEDLTKVQDPLLNLMAYMALTYHYPRKSTEAKDHCENAIKVLLEEMKFPNIPMSEFYKRLLCNDVVRTLQYTRFEKSHTISIFERIYEPLIEKKDAHNLAVWNPSFGFSFYYLCDTPQTAKRCIKLLEKIAAVLDNSEDSKDTGSALSLIKDTLARISDKYPDLAAVDTTENLAVTLLLNKEDWPKRKNTFRYIRALLKGNMLWVAFAEPGVDLASINLTGNRLTSVQHVNCDRGTVLYANVKGSKLSGSITGIADVGNECYVSIRDVGLIRFPYNTAKSIEFQSSPRILTDEDGLPSVSITGIASVNNKLWIAYGGREKESGLIIYDPQNGNWEIVFCSSLKGNDPFSGGQTYAIASLTPGPKNKLFFLVGEREFDPKINYQMEQWWGLWKINTNTKQLKHLWHDDQYPLVLENIDDFGKSWWLRDLRSLIWFDPGSETATFIMGWSRVLRKADTMPQLHQDLFVPKSSPKKIECGFTSSGFIDLRTAAVHQNQLWARLGKSQLIILHKGKGFEEAEIIENNILNGGQVLRFFSTPYGLIAIGGGTVGLIETRNNEK